MTDILTRLAQRLAAPQQSLRPAPRSRFEPDTFDEPAALEEIAQERVAHQPPSSPIQAGTPADDPCPPMASPSVMEQEDGTHPVSLQNAPPPTPSPASTTSMAPTQSTVDEAVGHTHREQTPNATEQGTTTERIEVHKVEQDHQRELQVETRMVETRIVERHTESSQHPPAAKTSKPAPVDVASQQVPVDHRNATGSLLRPVARRVTDPKPAPSPVVAQARDTVKKELLAPPTPVQVHIDRLEVRVSPPKAVVAARKPTRPKTVDLERFLTDLEGRS